MKTLYTEEEFETAKSRENLPLECKQCGKTFGIPKHHIQYILSGNANFVGDFCSPKCGHLSQALPPIMVVCKNCGEEFRKKPFEIKRSPNHFCSLSCAGTYNSTHKKHGTRRSKLEVWLEQQLLDLYPDLPIDFNSKTAINSELDIFFPSLSLAIEINGIFHYEPIYGQGKLESVQNNDQRKFAACREKGISLCVIDTTAVKYFKPKKVKRYLDIITKLVNENLEIVGQNKIGLQNTIVQTPNMEEGEGLDP